MAKSAKSICEQIIKSEKGFDINAFIKNELSDFWIQLSLYEKQLANGPTVGVLKRKTFVSTKKIVGAFQKLLPLIKSENIHKNDIPNISLVFRYLFHNETEDSVRDSILTLFLIMMLQLPPDSEPFNEVAQTLVPFVRFARGEDEIKPFEKCYEGTVGIKSKKPFTNSPNSTIISLRFVLSFVNSNWTRYTNLVSKLLLQSVLQIAYRELAEKCKISSFEFGFKSPCPDAIHQIIFDFLQKFNQTENDITPLLSQPGMTRFFMSILQTAKQDSHTEMATAIQYITKMATSTEVLDRIAAEASDIFIELFDYAPKLLAQHNEVDIKMVNDFTFAFFNLCFLRFSLEDIAKILDDKFNKSHYEPFAELILINGLYNIVLSKGITGESISKALSSLVESSSIVSAASAKYSQYLALLSFSKLYGIEKENLIETCHAAVAHSKATKTKQPYDWVAANIDEIVNNPPKFAMEQIHHFWKSHEEHNKLISQMVLPTLKLSDDVSIVESIDFFLSLFSNFASAETIEGCRNLYAPYLNFYGTLGPFANLPPDTRRDHEAPLLLIFNALISAALHPTDFQIRNTAFKVLAPITNPKRSRTLLGAGELSMWYMACSLAMLSDVEPIRDLGFRSALECIKHNFLGATMLVPLMLSLIEIEAKPLSPLSASFLSSVPIFEITSPLPKEIIEKINEILPNGNFVSNAQNIIELCTNNDKSDEKDMIQRVLDLADKAHAVSMESKQWAGVLAIYAAIIAECDSKNLINSAHGKLIEAVMTGSHEAIQILDGPLKERLISTVPETVKKSLGELIKFVTNLPISQIELIFQIANLICNNLICNGSVFKDNDQSDVNFFAEYLATKLLPCPEVKHNDKIAEQIKRIISLLSSSYGLYPYPHSSLYPSFLEVDSNKIGFSQIFRTSSDYILAVSNIDKNNQNEVSLDTQSQIGHFSWNFENIASAFLIQDTAYPVSLNLMMNDDEIPISEEQQKFSSLFDEQLLSIEKLSGKEFSLDFFNENVISDNSIAEADKRFESLNCDVNENQNESENKDNNVFICPNKYAENPMLGLFTALGYSSPQINDVEDDTLTPLDQTEAVFSEFGQIASNSARLKSSASVLYVKEDNIDSEKLASVNEDTSLEFKDFLNGLGASFDISENFVGFSDDLDKSSKYRDGKTILTYQDLHHEILFKTPSLMPAESSPQRRLQLVTKDFINIIWNESEADFSPVILTSPNTKVYIVVSPTPTGLFTVNLISKARLPVIVDTIITSKKSLHALIRTIVIEAEALRSRTEGPFAYPSLCGCENVKSLVRTGTSTNEKQGLLIYSRLTSKLL